MEEFSFTTAQINYPLGAAAFHSGQHRAEPLLVQTNLLLDGRFLLGMGLLSLVGRRLLLVYETLQSVIDEIAPVFQIARCN
ncbi:hypothetical protein SDC9_166370 [bioreactor metagenome]|uniref:Uncharacterized protein n=1 Tax=bioreactor metagenome TaxID=1076179 RepID=A0A645G4D5_9ZZZZ